MHRIKSCGVATHHVVFCDIRKAKDQLAEDPFVFNNLIDKKQRNLVSYVDDCWGRGSVIA